jgi:hypothetical protein
MHSKLGKTLGMAAAAAALTVALVAPASAHHRPGHGGPKPTPTPVATPTPSSTPVPTPTPTPTPSPTPVPTPTPPPSPIPTPTPGTGYWCGTPSTEPVTASSTWTYFESPEPCSSYRMRIYPTFGWVWFTTPLWYWAYERADSADDPVAFQYGGFDWTYMSDGSNCCFTTDDPPPVEEEGF